MRFEMSVDHRWPLLARHPAPRQDASLVMTAP
jgi:hypothetical protein